MKMTEKQKLTELRDKIHTLSNTWDIAGFLKEDLYKFVLSINSRKAEKLLLHIGMFKKYIYLLDDQNTKQMGYFSVKDPYYISKRGIIANAKKKSSYSVVESQTRIIKISSKIRAMFIFQAPEFCNGSNDRLRVIDFAKIRETILRKCQEKKI